MGQLYLQETDGSALPTRNRWVSFTYKRQTGQLYLQETDGSDLPTGDSKCMVERHKKTGRSSIRPSRKELNQEL